MRHLIPVLIIPILLLAGCGGGGGASPADDAPVVLYHPSGRIAATGHVARGTTTRVGEWEDYFDLDGSPLQTRRIFIAGTWDQSRDWREWNADGSIRSDRMDR